MKFLKEIYEKHFKVLLLIPVILLIAAFVQIGYQTATTGDFVNKGVSLKGGITVSINEVADVEELENALKLEFPNSDINVRALSRTGTQIGFLVEASDVDSTKLINSIKNKFSGLTADDYSVETMGSSLGENFFKETFIAMIFAFLFMAIVVFAYFRTFVPSLAVVLAALSDIVVTISIVNLIVMKLGTAGIAAFLMLIGYSVDTDILLSTKVLKRSNGTIMERIYSAMTTGLTMSITTMIALIVALVFTQSEVLKQIMTILLIGLVIDLVNTWIQNTGILRWYLERKNKV